MFVMHPRRKNSDTRPTGSTEALIVEGWNIFGSKMDALCLLEATIG